MAKKKVAGTERPYTWREFHALIEKIAKEFYLPMAGLDYFIADSLIADKPIDISVWDWHVVSETDFGGNEGIYSDFYVVKDGGVRTHIFTAKTLSDDEVSYVTMHEFAARVCLIIRKYVYDHSDEFNWTGYDVGWWHGEERECYMMAHEFGNALKYAAELKRAGERAWIRNNETREYEEYS